VELDDAVLFALFGSVVVEEAMLAVFVMTVPGFVPAVTFSINVNVAVAFAATEAFVHV
jgi:hypothetical protein